jgi:hypothetical protein
LYKSDNSDDDNEETHFNNDVYTIIYWSKESVFIAQGNWLVENIKIVIIKNIDTVII